MLATTAAGSLLGLVYVAALHSSATDVLTDWNVVVGPLLFALMVAGAALSMIADVRCMTARRWNLVIIRITLVGLARFPLLFLARDGDHRGLWLFLFATAPMAVSGALSAAFAPRLAGGRLRLGPRPATARAAVRYSAVNYVSQLAYQAPYFALPVIVLAFVTSDSYASFNVAWGIVAVAFYVPTALGQALLAEGGRDGAHLRSQVHLAMVLALGLMTVGAVVAYFGRDVVTTIYGADYAEAAQVLPAMVAAGIPWAVTSLLLSEVRILHRHAATVAITLGAHRRHRGARPDPGARRGHRRGQRLVVHRQPGRRRHRRGGHPGQPGPGRGRRPDRRPVLSSPATAADAAEVGITLAEHSA